MHLTRSVELVVQHMEQFAGTLSLCRPSHGLLFFFTVRVLETVSNSHSRDLNQAKLADVQQLELSWRSWRQQRQPSAQDELQQAWDCL